MLHGAVEKDSGKDLARPVTDKSDILHSGDCRRTGDFVSFCKGVQWRHPRASHLFPHGLEDVYQLLDEDRVSRLVHACRYGIDAVFLSAGQLTGGPPSLSED